MLKNPKTYIAFSIVPLYFIVKLLSRYPEFIETYYSNGLYPVISNLFRFTLGWIPFSFGDLVYAFSIIYMIRWFILNRKRIIKDTKNWLIDVFAAVSIIYFAFHLFWAMNYYRQPLHQNLNLEADYTTEQLITVTKQLIEKSNALHLQITNNDTVKVVMPYSKTELLQQVPKGYDVLEKDFPHLSYKRKSIKKSLFSLPLTFMGFSGYLNPLTNEAQVDALIPKYKFPTTASHEVAHQLGYAKENEANFIGFLAATNNPDIYFNYSGFTFGLKHCLLEVYRRDPVAYEALLDSIHLGIIKNYQETQDFWNSYQNITEPIFKLFYTNFLKANNQQGGMKSYSYVVALLVNYYQSETL
ncbi:DUF3810 family protein [Lacinutrix sp. WUR7]|uniref:DUF3810 domain-containing protein n=1 Tax=Lacinutrix sp. WUR7 TaxID=2653681 RepID=UPI00193D664E|nr:DUF3810 domain-containing protein [Lacinutrix sp. WUR7]QRM89704.1 DUF3810 family protein [Lacinutrix sp. WUR7]